MDASRFPARKFDALILPLTLVNVCLKVWDMRKGTAIMDVRHHQDYISDMTVDQARRTLLTARLAADVT